ncbi:unnamed protein product [Eruca vesicaria subsp. sativa]|uniref:Uncharacterized protein n=1 Tax=Eruca vesicaria subsp. sativa TaxID=29727 RepID=A0ABC8JEE2_ERUVS|nr:unnamed protein product [Eruca vesicaria subsp. sativa]
MEGRTLMGRPTNHGIHTSITMVDVMHGGERHHPNKKYCTFSHFLPTTIYICLGDNLVLDALQDMEIQNGDGDNLMGCDDLFDEELLELKVEAKQATKGEEAKA